MKNEMGEKVMPDFGKKMAQPEACVWKVGDADAAFIESKIGMTIAVDMQDREEHFTILDLKMYHQECEDHINQQAAQIGRNSRPQDVSSRM